MKHRRRNDREREMWVLNDEGLYRWHYSTGLSMRAFLRKFRTEIDYHIDARLNRKG
jgi:hypothetical protein